MINYKIEQLTSQSLPEVSKVFVSQDHFESKVTEKHFLFTTELE